VRQANQSPAQPASAGLFELIHKSSPLARSQWDEGTHGETPASPKMDRRRKVMARKSLRMSPANIDLSVELGRLQLRNPILAASGTFGYAREMERLIDFSGLGGILPKTVTKAPRIGNKPWRTVETACGLLNSIGLDNDGID
jgi:hypothetical protein